MWKAEFHLFGRRSRLVKQIVWLVYQATELTAATAAQLEDIQGHHLLLQAKVQLPYSLR